jgi:drug/metabolite transporter (DMT)-like permease
MTRILSTSRGSNVEKFSSQDWALFAGVSLIWGASFLFIDVGLDAFHPGLVTLLRVGFGAGMLALVPKARRRIQRVDWPRLVVLSAIWVGAPFTLFPIAQQWINSAVAGMLNGAVPLFASVVSALMLRRLPRGAQAIGLVVGLVGVVAISAPSAGDSDSQAIGVALVLLATVMYGLSINIAVPMQQKYGSLPMMMWMLTLATIWTAPYGLVGLAGSSWSRASFAAVLVLGVVGTGLAFVIMGSLAGSVGPTRASFITYVIPVVALALGVVFRGDAVSFVAVSGSVLVIAGALLASRREA